MTRLFLNWREAEETLRKALPEKKHGKEHKDEHSKEHKAEASLLPVAVGRRMVGSGCLWAC